MLSTAAIRAPLRIATSHTRSLTSTLIKQPPLQQSLQTKCFSTKPTKLQKETPQTKKPTASSSAQPPNGQPEVPTFSLDGLGISPGMKKVIIGVICIFGTMETYTYYIWIKNRWFPDEKVDEEAVKG